MGAEQIFRKRQAALKQPAQSALAASLPLDKESGNFFLPMKLGQPSALVAPREALHKPNGLFEIIVINGVSAADYKFALRVLEELLQLPNDFQSGPEYITRAFVAKKEYPITRAKFNISAPPPDLSDEIKAATALVIEQAQRMKVLAELFELDNSFVYINRSRQDSQGFHAVIKRATAQIATLETPQINSLQTPDSLPTGWFDVNALGETKNR